MENRKQRAVRRQQQFQAHISNSEVITDGKIFMVGATPTKHSNKIAPATPTQTAHRITAAQTERPPSSGQ